MFAPGGSTMVTPAPARVRPQNKGGGPAPQVTWVGVWQDTGGTRLQTRPPLPAPAQRPMAEHPRALCGWASRLSGWLEEGLVGTGGQAAVPPIWPTQKGTFSFGTPAPGGWVQGHFAALPEGSFPPPTQTSFGDLCPCDPDPDTEIKVCTVVSRSLTGSAVTPKPASTALNHKDEKP